MMLRECRWLQSKYIYITKNPLFFFIELIIYILEQVSISYLEIYNELIRDLLNSGGPLELREDTRELRVRGLSEIITDSRDEVFQLLLRGNKARTIEPTCNSINLKIN